MKSSRILSWVMILNLAAGGMAPLWGQGGRQTPKSPQQGPTEKAARGSVKGSRSSPGKSTPGKSTPGRSTPGKANPGRTTPGRSTGVASASRSSVRGARHRPPKRRHQGYGRYNNNNDAFKWIALAAIVVKLLDNLNEQQQRKHEAAQIEATTAPVGQPQAWEDGNASGSVTTIKESQDSSGAYCREFQQEITVGGETEQAYGTACLQPDGAWKIVSD
jgi:surface antigen